jgi:hypothetical protein
MYGGRNFTLISMLLAIFAFPQELTRVLLALISSIWFLNGVNTGPLGYRLEFNKYTPPYPRMGHRTRHLQAQATFA